jgi:hypothetical protein
MMQKSTISRQEMRKEARDAVKQTRKEIKQKYANDNSDLNLKKLKEKYLNNITKIRKEFDISDENVKSVADALKDQQSQITYTEDKEDIKEDVQQTTKEYIAIALLEAEKIWYNIQAMILESYEDYTKSSDEEKINLLRKDYKEFYNEFPIVSRYMVCLGQYSKPAFHKYLTACCKTLNNLPENREKGYTQDQWIRRQADYVRFLWEEINSPINNRHKKKESDKIWKQTYDNLTNEFKEFNNLHQNVEKKIKVDDKRYKSELVKEFATRIINQQQNLDKDDTIKLLYTLKQKLYKQRFNKVIKQIKEEIKCMPHTTESYGNNKEAQDEYEKDMKQSEYIKKYKKLV